LRNQTIPKAAILLTIIVLTPGVLTLLYSQTFISVGIGATDWWWGNNYTPDYYASLSVSNSTPIVTETLHGEQLIIGAFNITGGNVTIIVSSEMNGTIATYDSVTGVYFVYLTYPTTKPTGNYEQDFNVTILWEDNNVTTTFQYNFNKAMHSDGSVTYIFLGYEEIHALGETLLISGLIMTGIIVVTSLIVIGNKRTKN